jgi:hypothetical protein
MYRGEMEWIWGEFDRAVQQTGQKIARARSVNKTIKYSKTISYKRFGLVNYKYFNWD